MDDCAATTAGNPIITIAAHATRIFALLAHYSPEQSNLWLAPAADGLRKNDV